MNMLDLAGTGWALVIVISTTILEMGRSYRIWADKGCLIAKALAAKLTDIQFTTPQAHLGVASVASV